MALEFGQIEPAQLGTASRFDIPLNEWLGVQFEAGRRSQFGPRLTSFMDEFSDTSPLMSGPDATNEFGIPGHLNFDVPVRAARAREMRERKDAELKYAAYQEAALHSWFSAKAAFGTLAALVGGSTHPVDLAVNFLPFVGQEAKAAQLATRGAGVFRQRLARGLITQEAIAAAPILSRFPNYSRHIIDATLGNAVLEIPNFYLARRNQEQYDESDFAFNVFGGGLAGGTLAIGLKKLFTLAHFGYVRLHGETRDAMHKDAMGEALSGERRPVEQRAAVDEQTIRDSLRFDEDGERARILKELESKPVRAAIDDLDAIEAAAFGRDVEPEPPVGSVPPLSPGITKDKVGEGISFESPDAKLGDTLVEAGREYRVSAITEVTRNGKTTRLATAHPAGPATATRPAAQDAVRGEMAKRVETILKQRRAEAKAMVEGKISEAKAQALDADIARAKTMTDEQVQQFAATMAPGERIKFLEADTATKTEIAAEANKNLDDYATRLEIEAAELEKVGRVDEANSKLKQADELRQELKDAEASIVPIPDKAIDAARPCITGT